MRWIAAVRLRLRSLFQRSRLDDELDEELRYHLDQQIDLNLARGLSPEESRRQAGLAMGGLEQRKEECRDTRRMCTVENVFRDLVYAVRILSRSPGFACIAILSLTLGIGANTAVFQLLDVVRLRSLPVPAPQELMEIQIAGGHGGTGLNAGLNSEFTNPLWEQLRDNQQAFSGVFAWNTTGFLVGRGAHARVVNGLWISGGAFSALRVAPARGRLFTADEDRRGCGPRQAVISDAFWHSYFARDESAVGQALTIMGRPIEIIGVTPPEFFGLEVGKRFEVALPICAAATWGNTLDQRHVWWLSVMGRLKPDWTPAQAVEHLRTISPGLFDATAPDGYEQPSRDKYRQYQLTAERAASGISGLRRDYEGSLWLLLGITAMVLIIACANLANLMLARGSARGREIAVRVAIGASRARIVSQLLTESLLLAAAGAVFGAALASVLSRSLISFLTTENDPLHLDMTFDWRVFAFSALVAILTCVVFGFVPAMRASHIDPGAAMKSGGRGLTAHRGRFSFQRMLVVAQVAASLVLLVGALLFVRSFRNLITLDIGLRRDGIVLLELADLSEAQRPTHRAAEVLATEAALLAQIRSVPRVDAAAASSQFPLTGGSWTQGVRIPGERDEPRHSSKFTYVSDGYFRTMHIGLLAGRDVSELDTAAGPKVLVVNEIFARLFFPNQDPLGRRVRTVAEPNYPETVYEVVGVVTDTAYGSLRDERPPIVYVPIAQHPNLQSLRGIVLRASGPLADVLADVRRTVSDAYPDIAVRFQPFEMQIRDRLVRERVMAWLAGFFGALATILAIIGLYGVVAYIAAQRRQEIGIRLALGASRPQVVSLVLRETALMLLVGLGVGALLAIAAARGVAAMLFGLSPHDAPTTVACVLLLAASGVAATAVPAIRAAHADPTDALRCD